MSYDTISRPAVEAFSKAAKNTCEGDLSPTHLEGGSDMTFQTGKQTMVFVMLAPILMRPS